VVTDSSESALVEARRQAAITAADVGAGSACPRRSGALLTLSNVEVLYAEVILALKGVSMQVPAARLRGPAGRQRRRQEHHPEGHLRRHRLGRRPRLGRQRSRSTAEPIPRHDSADRGARPVWCT
jgi:hypothetical protein